LFIAVCALFFCARIAAAGLDKYSTLVVADANNHGPARFDRIRVTYLGVAGYQLEVDGNVLLIDPYFTRADFWSVALNRPLASKHERVDEGFAHLRPKADAVLISHAHFDHLLDVPDIMHRTGARLIAGRSAINLVEPLGAPPEKCNEVRPGSVRSIGPWKIRVYGATHDRLFGSIPYPGKVETEKRPVKPSDWRLGEPLAFVIEAAGQRVYIDSGGAPGTMPRTEKVDLAILGMALPDSRRRFAEALRQLRPRYILPSHQDDFFSPLRRGFVFGKLTNFPELLRQHQKQNLPGRMILLDYFRPWTLPR
jgi:L-ascorbate metabolism protein UlaG (beta-lactamase superfamily)